MYRWVVYLHVVVIFIFLIQHAAEIWVTFRLREQKAPEGIFAAYAFMPDNNVRNLRITYSLIILSGLTAGLITPWWKQGWMWTALAVMILIGLIMRRVGATYLTAVDGIAERAQKNKEDPSCIDQFRSELKARREPEMLSLTAIVGGLGILWLMMFKPF
jgi:hypothetical protein